MRQTRSMQTTPAASARWEGRESTPFEVMLVAMAAVVGCRLGIRPKKRDDWLVVPNLWGCVVGRPSLKKTPATKGAEKELRYIEARSRDQLAEKIEDAELELLN